MAKVRQARVAEEVAVVPRTHFNPHASAKGSVLLLVLVVVAMMGLGTGSYLVLMHNEHVAARYTGSKQQARMLAESGADFLKLFLSQSKSSIDAQGGVYENLTWMQAQLVADDAAMDFRGRFTVVAPAESMGFYGGFRFGLEDESAKLNLNALAAKSSSGSRSSGSGGSTGSSSGSGGSSGNGGSGSGSSGSSNNNPGQMSAEEEARFRLMALPGMTEDVADAILDWIDEDDEPRAYGAEEEHYTSLTPSYEPRNGPLTSLDELLQVRGVTPELLYGSDVNRNFALEVTETPRGAVALVDNFNGQMDRGWAAYLTLYGMELLETPEGDEKIDLNAGDLQQLYDDLSPYVGDDEAKFIVLYRQYGPAGEDAEGRKTSASSIQLDFDKSGSTNINSVLDLVGASVSIQSEENNQAPPELVESPWQESSAEGRSLMDLLDYARAESDLRIRGRINVNQASRAVLLSIPSMTDTLADQIISRRMPIVDPVAGEGRHALWLWADGIVDLEEMRELEPYLTAGGDVYSCQIVGFFDGAPMQSRLRVVLDRTSSTVEALVWEDLSTLGTGFTQNVLLGLGPEPGLQSQPQP